MDLLEALKFKEECKGGGILCINCPLRISQRFVRDDISTVEFGIKASVCDLFSLIELFLGQIEAESDHKEKVEFFERMGGKGNG